MAPPNAISELGDDRERIRGWTAPRQRIVRTQGVSSRDREIVRCYQTLELFQLRENRQNRPFGDKFHRDPGRRASQRTGERKAIVQKMLRRSLLSTGWWFGFKRCRREPELRAS
jgi:hypothetical protein